MRRWIWIAAAGLFAASLFAEERAIGFQVLARRDTGRRSTKYPDGRPLQISVWYPARPGSAGARLTFRDYVALAASETSPGAASSAAEARTLQGYRAFLSRAGAAAADVDSWLATPMRASRDAEPLRAPFPLVLIAPGNGDSAADQAFLAERIAARGFVVAAIPSQANLDGSMTSEADIPAHAAAQAADLEFAKKAVASQLGLRRGPCGVVGHSFGARSALLFAMRDPAVGALVSLDGGIGSRTGKGLLEKAPGFDVARAKAPLLHLYEDGDPSMPVDLELLRSLPGTKWLVRVDAMRHVHFSTAGILATRIPAIAARTGATKDTGAAWEAVADAAASFLERLAGGPAPWRAAWAPPASAFLHEVPGR